MKDQMELICCFLGDGTLTFISKAYYYHLGQGRRLLIEQKFFPFIAAENKAVLTQPFTSLNRENPILTTEFRVMTNDEMN